MKIEISGDTGIPDILVDKKKEMLTLTKVDGKIRVKINSSSLSILQECWRKSEYALKRKLISLQQSPATLYGSAIHTGLETFYLGSRSDRLVPPQLEQIVESMGAGAPPDESETEYLVFRAIRAFLDAASPLAGLPASDKRSLSTGAWTLMHYFKTYIDDPYEVYVDDDGPFIERMLEHKVFDNDKVEIILFGTIDVIFRNAINGNILVVDHKTSSIVGAQFFNRIKPNHQFTAYTHLVQKNGIDTNKFMVNCLEVKPKPKTARGTPPNFPRQVTTRTEEDIDEFIQTLVHYVLQYVDMYEEENWPMSHVSACASYAGCQFLNVCQSPKLLRENIIEAEYQ